MKIILEWHDLHWHPEVNCLSIAEKLIARYPPIILNFFVPAGFKNNALRSDKKWCDDIRVHINNGNIVLGVHGFLHSHLEMSGKNYLEAHCAITCAEDSFKDAELPFVKCFCPPYWVMNRETVDALINLKYTHLYKHINFKEMYNREGDSIKNVFYSWNTKDPYGIFENPIENNIVIGHGHSSNVCQNGIEESYDRICAALDNNNFEFLRIDKV